MVNRRADSADNINGEEPMRYAILSDIHGNVEALTAVLHDIAGRSIDKIVCLGDVVGYYPDPEECVALVRQNVALTVAGNHDYAAIGKIDTSNFTYYAYVAMEWTKRHISPDAKKFLESLPLTIEEDGLFFTHASPSNPSEWVYVFPDSEEAVFHAFSSLVHRINFIGHTHWPSIMIADDDKIMLRSEHEAHLEQNLIYLINVGSVGQPRDFDPRSSYAIYDTEKADVSILRVSYDYTITQQKIAQNSQPDFLADRLEKGR
jgi:diadenosine tetraphosphatase ApaH/serine/threonine PP2A family protein phosphatase